MASSMGRFLRTARPYRTIVSPKTLNPFVVPSRHPLLPPNYRYHKDHFYSNAFERPRPISGFESSGSFSMCSAIIAGLIGIGLVDIAYADAEQEAVKPALPAECSASFDVMEELARKERHRLEELIKSKGMKYGAFPMFTVAVKGQKVTIRFRIPPSCEIPHLIANLVSNLGLKVKEHGAGSEMLLRAWDSAVAWQLTLSNPEKQKESGGMQGLPGYTNEQKGDLCILIFHSLISADKAEIEFIKQGSFSPEELDALVSAMQLVGEKMGGNKNLEMKPKGDTSVMPSIEKSISSLEALGVRVFGLDVPQLGFSSSEISWENIAGYDKQKREIEDTVLLALHSPEVYDDIARGTRCKFESNRPRAVLFEGPPGTGKTSCARVIANQAGVPLLYVPLEAIVSKYYGESERSLGKVFKIANELPNGAIIFLDEVDSFAVTRDSDIHEATRRMLSVLLRQMDGYEQDKKVVVIAATNRKQDLDPALLSRFNTMITFGLPDQQNREAIAAQFAKHLKKSELVEFARVTEEMSGRDIRDVCQQAERRWASKIIRGQAARDGDKWHLPPLQEYINSAMDRQKAMREIGDQKFRNPNTWKPKLDFS